MIINPICHALEEPLSYNALLPTGPKFQAKTELGPNLQNGPNLARLLAFWPKFFIHLVDHNKVIPGTDD